MTEPALLATQNLSRNFGGLQAVRDVTLDFRIGQLHAVIGPNGAGKSTFVNLLAGELPPSSGSIALAGENISALPAHARVHRGIARSFQRTNIFKDLTALENVRLAAQAVARGGVFKRASKATALVDTAQAALKRAGLPWAATRVAGTLSHGAQRQLEIAMTLATDPKVILLDEPLAGMGQEEGDRIATLLKSLATDHAVLLIEHDMDFVFKVADVMTVLVDGIVIASGKPSDVRASAEVQRAYLGGH
jgi:branched-chain amino acid transport system ATP-binding protein